LEAIGRRNAFEYVISIANSDTELTERIIKDIRSLFIPNYPLGGIDQIGGATACRGRVCDSIYRRKMDTARYYRIMPCPYKKITLMDNLGLLVNYVTRGRRVNGVVIFS
jgi:hypothetical protein